MYNNAVKNITGDDMKISELLRILKKNSCTIVRNGSNHDIYYSPISKQKFAVPRHQEDDIGKRLLNKIQKQSGIRLQ